MEDFNSYKKKQYITKAFNASFWTILGAVLPLILGSIILFACSQSSKWIGFVDRGDFCIYSAGLLSSSLFVLSDNKEHIKKWHNSILYPSTFVLIIIAATLYCAIYIVGELLKDQNSIVISVHFVRYMSFSLILLSIIITYRSLIIDFKARPPKVDVVKKSGEEVQNIMNQLGS
ncbi:hypothetical protein ACFFGT_20060 [Mucilaginibacter angelicae]|uniref:Uncharacterized protein n=1 Tax=Mucilaginibacter angelicae TaxID=869718 RepID=A0ABV6LAM6_9SPHI